MSTHSELLLGEIGSALIRVGVCVPAMPPWAVKQLQNKSIYDLYFSWYDHVDTDDIKHESFATYLLAAVRSGLPHSDDFHAHVCKYFDSLASKMDASGYVAVLSSLLVSAITYTGELPAYLEQLRSGAKNISFQPLAVAKLPIDLLAESMGSHTWFATSDKGVLRPVCFSFRSVPAFEKLVEEHELAGVEMHATLMCVQYLRDITSTSDHIGRFRYSGGIEKLVKSVTYASVAASPPTRDDGVVARKTSAEPDKPVLWRCALWFADELYNQVNYSPETDEFNEIIRLYESLTDHDSDRKLSEVYGPGYRATTEECEKIARDYASGLRSFAHKNPASVRSKGLSAALAKMHKKLMASKPKRIEGKEVLHPID